MKKTLSCLLLGLAFVVPASADNNYPDDDDVVVVTSKNNTSGSTSSGFDRETIAYWGLGFFAYDGVENYSMSYGAYNVNGFGLGINLRSNWKFSDYQNTFNADVLLNYSISVYTNDDVAILITPEIGPSVGSRYVYDDDEGDAKDEYFIDAFAGIKATVAFKKVVLSAGYHAWAAKWKFGKDYRADGFYAQIGIDI